MFAQFQAKLFGSCMSLQTSLGLNGNKIFHTFHFMVTIMKVYIFKLILWSNEKGLLKLAIHIWGFELWIYSLDFADWCVDWSHQRLGWVSKSSPWGKICWFERRWSLEQNGGSNTDKRLYLRYTKRFCLGSIWFQDFSFEHFWTIWNIELKERQLRKWLCNRKRTWEWEAS